MFGIAFLSESLLIYALNLFFSSFCDKSGLSSKEFAIIFDAAPKLITSSGLNLPSSYPSIILFFLAKHINCLNLFSSKISRNVLSRQLLISSCWKREFIRILVNAPREVTSLGLYCPSEYPDTIFFLEHS